MKGPIRVGFTALLALLAPLAQAGEDHYKCDRSTQDCLDMMVKEYSRKGFLGVEPDRTAEGELIIRRVLPDSAADAAGFMEDDILLSVNGVSYISGTKEEWSRLKKDMVPGGKVTYLVLRLGMELELTATLTKPPREVLAQWVGNHMLEHAQAAPED